MLMIVLFHLSYKARFDFYGESLLANRLWIKAAFYSVMFVVAGACFGAVNINISVLLKALLPISTKMWWFISNYFALYLVHPFLNDILHNLTRSSCKKLIVIALVVLGAILISNEDVVRKSAMEFIIIYSIGGYIRLWADDKGSSRYIL